jgi:hypothetical protein
MLASQEGGWEMTVVCYLTTLPVSILYSVDDGMMNKYGAVCGMRIDRENRSARRKPTPVPLSEPQMSHELTWDRTRAVAMGSIKRQKQSNLK